MHLQPAQPARPLGQSEALRPIVVHMHGSLTRRERVLRLIPAEPQQSRHGEMVYGRQAAPLKQVAILNLV